jgi:hypothetical protein
MAFRHHLPALLGEAFGGSTSLVDVARGLNAHRQSRSQHGCKAPNLLHITAAASRASVEAKYLKHHAVAEVLDLPERVFVDVVGADDVFSELADRQRALECGSQRCRLPDRIGIEEARESVEVPRLRASSHCRGNSTGSGVVDSWDIARPVSRRDARRYSPQPLKALA